MFCRQCGRELAADTRYCPHCGADQTAASNAPPPPQPFAAPPPPAPAAPPHNNNALVIGGIAAILILALLGLVAYFAMGLGRQASQTALANSMGMAGNEQVASGPAVGGEIIKYVASAANIRNTATAQGSGVVGSLRRGEQVKGTMHQGLVASTYWFKLSDGRGYVSAVNLSDAAPPPAQPAVRVAVAGAPFCTVATSSGNLRIRAAPNGAIIGGMPRGARFQAYNQQSDAAGVDWYMVQPVESRFPVGWVSGDFVIC